MKILYIYGNMTHYDHGLSKIVKRTKDVFSELEVETETLDLGALHPPYYDGETTTAIDGVMEKIKAADGVVFASTAQLFAPTALMLSFLEYFENPDYAEVLSGKHCFLLALSKGGGEKSALEQLAQILGFLGGYAAASIGLQTRHMDTLDAETGEFVDKITEDFYRAVHQKRQYVIPADFSEASAKAEESPDAGEPEFKEAEPQVVDKYTSQLVGFTDTQEQEIEELSELFSKKYAAGDAKSDAPFIQSAAKAMNTLNAPRTATTAAPSASPAPKNQPSNPFAPTADEVASTAKALTAELPKSFRSQLSAGLQAVIQINITGDEAFDGFLYIHSTECTYTDGTAPAPDITIMADSEIWQDVISHKITAQKAFMTGGIKVRGDFVLLTKFDTLFSQEEQPA